MPWLRINGIVMHVHGRKLAQGCQFHVLIDGKRQLCLAPTSLLCDWPTGIGRTCDAPMCDRHALEVAADRHFCPHHNAQRGLLSRLLPAPSKGSTMTQPVMPSELLQLAQHPTFGPALIRFARSIKEALDGAARMREVGDPDAQELERQAREALASVPNGRTPELAAMPDEREAHFNRLRDAATKAGVVPTQLDWFKAGFHYANRVANGVPGKDEGRKPCPHCDDTGDVHDAAGEWRGRCTCPAGAAIPATWQHDAGAYARCSFCLRYTRNPKALSHSSFLCDCGSAEGWSGSFAKPGPDARWFASDRVGGNHA